MTLKLQHTISQIIGHVLSQVPLNALERRAEVGKIYIWKRRHWYATPLIIAGNLYLRILGTHVQVLSLREWLMWECHVYKEILGRKAHIENNHTLVIPYLEGLVLSEFLKTAEKDSVKKIEAFSLVIQVIESMHKCQIIWPDGVSRPFSHGDITAKNVIYNDRSNSCYIIDYETVHDTNMPTKWRQADDLRSITYSVAEYVDQDMFQQLSLALIHNYSDKMVLLQLKRYIESLQQRSNVYYLAQSCLGFEKKNRLDTTILNEIEIALR